MTHTFYKKPGTDITWSLGDLTVRITDAIIQPTGFIPYLPNGASLQNAILLDNDFPKDTPERSLASRLAHEGKMNLVGNIATFNPDKDWPWTGPERQVKLHWDAEEALIKGLNNIPTYLRGSTRLFASGSVESNEATALIIREALKAAAENPLIYLMGGGATTLANALILEPRIKDSIVVFHTNGFYKANNHEPQGYNTLDIAAALYVMRNMKYVSCNFKFYGDPTNPPYWYKGKDLGLTQAMVDALPRSIPNDMFKVWYRDFYKVEGMADATPLLWLLNHKVWTSVQKRKENGTVTTGDDYDYIFVDGHNWSLYGPTLINGFKM